MPRLRSLSLAENPCAGADSSMEGPAGAAGACFARLAEVAPGLQALDLSGVGLAGEEGALQAVCTALPPEIEALKLSVAKLGSGGLQRLLEALPALLRLRSLALVQVAAGDEGAFALAQALGDPARLPALRVLDLRGNPLSRQGAERLRRDLRAARPALRDLRVGK